MKIVSIDKVKLLPEHVEELKKYGTLVLYTSTPKNITEVKKRISDADIVIDNVFEMSKEIISCCKNLKLICVFGTGYDFIDLEESKKRNILVCNAHKYATESTAEHTFGLILNSVKLSSRAERDLRNGIWSPHNYRGIELKNKTLGIIGYGNIGKRVAEIAVKGFDMKILFVNTKSSRDDLKKLLMNSDIISVNASLNNKTRSILSSAEFQLMKHGVVIVNTGRGAIIDTQALINNVRSGKVFSVGLDVFDKEPIQLDNPLLSLENVALTPHIGFKTIESEFSVSQIVTNNIISYIKGNVRNIINTKD